MNVESRFNQFFCNLIRQETAKWCVYQKNSFLDFIGFRQLCFSAVNYFWLILPDLTTETRYGENKISKNYENSHILYSLQMSFLARIRLWTMVSRGKTNETNGSIAVLNFLHTPVFSNCKKNIINVYQIKRSNKPSIFSFLKSPHSTFKYCRGIKCLR